MYCIGLMMTLKPGCFEEYQRAHKNLWPELAEGMAANEVSMVIFRDGDRLFVHAIAPTENDWLKSRQDPTLDRWHEYMQTLLITDDRGDIDFQPLSPVFRFGVFDDSN